MKIFRVRIRAFPSKATFYISKLKTIFKSIKLCRILNLNFDGKAQMILLIYIIYLAFYQCHFLIIHIIYPECIAFCMLAAILALVLYLVS